MWRAILIHLTHTDIGSTYVEGVEGFLNRHHIWIFFTELWRMWRDVLIHLTHTDIGSISVEGFLNMHQVWACYIEPWKLIVPSRMFLNL